MPKPLNYESARLETFKSWPSRAIKPEHLADSGFYYVGRDDLVKCFFCRIEIGQWQKGDNVDQLHSLQSPRCPLMNGKPTKNVEWDDEPENGIRFRLSGFGSDKFIYSTAPSSITEIVAPTVESKVETLETSLTQIYISEQTSINL